MGECHNKRVTALAITHDALWSAGSTNGLLLLHSLQTMKLLAKIYFPGKGSDADFVTSLSTIHRTVWAGSSDGSLVIFNDESKHTTDVASCHSQAIYCIAAGDGCVLAGSADSVISIYTPAIAGPWQCAGTLRHHQAAVRALVAAPGGRVWSAGDDHVIAITDVRTGAVLMRIVDAAGPVLALAMAAEHVWSGSADRHIRCHHQQSGRTVRVLSAHQAWVTGLATTPTTLWSCSTDRTIREWDLASGHPVGDALDAPGGKLVWCVAALQDDSLIAAGLGDGRVLMLQRSPEGLRVCEGLAAATPALGSDTLNRQKILSQDIELVSIELSPHRKPLEEPGLLTPQQRLEQEQAVEQQHRQQQQQHEKALEQQRQQEQAELLEQQRQRQQLQEQQKQLEQVLEAQRQGLEKEHNEMLATQAALERQTRELQLERQQREQQMQAAAQLEARLRALMGERTQFQGMIGSLKAQLMDLTSGLERMREEAPQIQDSSPQVNPIASASAVSPPYAPAISAPATAFVSAPAGPPRPSPTLPRTSSPQFHSQPISSYSTLDRTVSAQTHQPTFSHDLPPVAPTSQTPSLRGWAAPAPAQFIEPTYAPPVLSPINVDPNDVDALSKIEAMRRELDRQFHETQRAAQMIKYQVPPL